MEVIRAALLADPTVAGLVGPRIFPSSMPPGTEGPAIVCRVVSDVPENDLSGASSDLAVNAMVQVDSFARTYLVAHQVADAVSNVLSNLSAPDLSAWRGVTRDLFDDTADLPHCASTDFSVWR